MFTREDDELVRVTLTLPRVDVDLLDRLGRLEGLNRSAELRSILVQFRPMLRQTVEAFEAAAQARDLLTSEAAQAKVSELERLLPEAQRVQDAYLGFMARLEGESAAAAAADPRPSNHGGHTPTPPPARATPEEAPEVWDHGIEQGSTAEDDD